jgi:hypothetical protein
MTDPVSQVAAMAQAASGMLRVARTLVEVGRDVDLAGLQNAVGRMCAAALDLPPEQGQALRPQLAAVLAELDALERALRAKEDPSAGGGGSAA